MLKLILKRFIRLLLSPFVIGDYIDFIGKDHKSRFSYSLLNLNPQIKDRTINTNFDRHYIYHTAWAARKVKEINPLFHIDISSSLYFSGIVSAFIPVNFFDFRPANLILPNLKCQKADLLKLHFDSNSVDSISCMHTVEHIGLGRYGDDIDPEGDLKAINELKRVVRPGGSLLFVVPMGKEAKIEFNAHRIYTYDQVCSYFDGFEIREFSFIPEDEKDGGIIINSNLLSKETYACGCFWFIKK